MAKSKTPVAKLDIIDQNIVSVTETGRARLTLVGGSSPSIEFKVPYKSKFIKPPQLTVGIESFQIAAANTQASLTQPVERLDGFNCWLVSQGQFYSATLLYCASGIIFKGKKKSKKRNPKKL